MSEHDELLERLTNKELRHRVVDYDGEINWYVPSETAKQAAALIRSLQDKNIDQERQHYNDTLRYREKIIEQAEEIRKLERDAKQARLIAEWANNNGWDGVSNSKILSRFVADAFQEQAEEIERLKDMIEGLHFTFARENQ